MMILWLSMEATEHRNKQNISKPLQVPTKWWGKSSNVTDWEADLEMLIDLPKVTH